MNIVCTRKWMRPLVVGIAMSLMGSPTSAAQSSLTVNLSGLRSQKGNIMICLWRKQDGKFPFCTKTGSFKNATVKATAASVTVTFPNVPSGDYAISAFHDENGNGKGDRNFMGRPTEGIALSNMDKGRRGRPSFDRSKFALNGPQTVSLSFMYF
jgi:uncharacterized protein (DUF2141 family)